MASTCPDKPHGCCYVTYPRNGNNPAFCRCRCHGPGADTYTKSEVNDLLEKVEVLAQLHAGKLRTLDQNRWDYVASALECIGKQSKCIFAIRPSDALLPPDDEGEGDDN